MSEPTPETSGIAAPMEWTPVDVTQVRGMTDEEVREFMDRPITGLAQSGREQQTEEANA